MRVKNENGIVLHFEGRIKVKKLGERVSRCQVSGEESAQVHSRWRR